MDSTSGDEWNLARAETFGSILSAVGSRFEYSPPGVTSQRGEFPRSERVDFREATSHAQPVDRPVGARA